jgi:hypothetical protein
MKEKHHTLRWISLLILTTLLLTACGTAKGAPESAAGMAAVEPDFFSALNAFQARYNFSAINMVDLDGFVSFRVEETGFLLQSVADEPTWLPDIVLQPGDGLAVTFSFSNENSPWAFVLEPAAKDSTLLTFTPEGLSAQLGDQAQLMAEYSATPDWQVETRYLAFLHLNDMGGLDLSVWPDGQLQQVTTASLARVSDTSYTLGMEAAAGQDLTIYSIIDLSGGTQKAAQAVMDDVPESETDSGTLSAEIVAALGDVPIVDTQAIRELQCNGQASGAEGVFTWGSGTNANCDLTLQMGQGLAFNFTLSQPVQEWVNMAYLMLNANMENSEMPTKKLGIPLANDHIEIKQDDETFDGVSFQDGFELQTGVTYSALILMNEQAEFDIRIWPAGQSDQAMTAKLGEADVPSTWRPVENENWVFGMWVNENQQVTLSHLSRITLGGDQVSAAAVISPASDPENTSFDQDEEPVAEDSWMATGIIPNLNDFYVSDFTPYSAITCADTVFNENAFSITAETDQLSYECQLDLANAEQGVIMEFVYQGDENTPSDSVYFNTALVNEDDGVQRIIRYNLFNNELQIKKDGQYLDFEEGIQTQGSVDWTPGRRYTLLIVTSFDKLFFLWPSDDPSQQITGTISGQTLYQAFGEMDSQSLWQMRNWQDAGVNLQVEHIYRFSAQ